MVSGVSALAPDSYDLVLIDAEAWDAAELASAVTTLSALQPPLPPYWWVRACPLVWCAVF